jgi:hypothetical protein
MDFMTVLNKFKTCIDSWGLMTEEETQIEPCDLIIAHNYSMINLSVTYCISSFN